MRGVRLEAQPGHQTTLLELRFERQAFSGLEIPSLQVVIPIRGGNAHPGLEPEAGRVSEEDDVLVSVDSLVGDERLHAIEQIIHQRFDLQKMSRYVLGRRNESRLSEQQLAAYTCEFKPFLSRYIGSRFGRYEQEQVEILGAKTKGKGVVLVETRILGGRFDQGVVTFALVKGKDDEWRAIDASFEGVSVVKNLRAQIKDELEQGGPDHLLEMLREKNGDGTNCVGV